MPHRPIGIPDVLRNDRAVNALLTQWRNCHMRHQVCRKRVNWTKKNAAEIEKRRRREKWELVSRIVEIERTLLTWCAKETRHHDIWMSKKQGAKLSRLVILQKDYYEHRRNARYLEGPLRRKSLRTRQAIVAEIRAIYRTWMIALFEAVFPQIEPPPPLPLHPTDLYPRKLKQASARLKQEVA